MKKNAFFMLAVFAINAFGNAAFAIEPDVLPDFSVKVEKSESVESSGGAGREAYEPSPFTLKGQAKKRQVHAMSNLPETLKSASASVDVITLDEIEAQGSPVISSLLNQMAGITIQSTGSAGQISTLRMRGTDRVRATMDGMRIDSPKDTSSTFFTQNIFSDDIESIEVVRGPQGSIGGTNASGGVIAMQTRKGQGPLKTETQSDFGNLGTFKERMAIMGSGENADYYLGLNYLKTDGGAWTSKLGRIDNDSYENFGLVGNFGTKLLNGNAELRNVFRLSDGKKGLGVGYGLDENWNFVTTQESNNYSRTIDTTNVVSFTHKPNDGYDYSAKFGLFNDNYSYYDMDNFDRMASRSQYKSTRLTLSTQHNFNYKDMNTMSVGYNFEPSFLKGTDDNIKANDSENGIYIHDVLNIKDKLYLRGGARVVDNNRYGTYVNPNASAALILPTFKLKGATTKFKGSFGQSVNMPTLYQRFATADYGFFKQIANENLEAERSTGFDAGVEQSFFDDKLTFDVTYFNTKYKDYIGYVNNESFTEGYYANVDSADTSGFEGRMTFAPSEKFKISANYTYTDSLNELTNSQLPGSPNNRINVTAYYTPSERFNFWVGTQGASSRIYSLSSKDDRTGGFADVSMGTSLRLFSLKNLHFYFKGQVNNLLNQNIAMYRNSGDTFYLPGVNFTAGLFVKYDKDVRIPKKEDL